MFQQPDGVLHTLEVSISNLDLFATPATFFSEVTITEPFYMLLKLFESHSC